jgi:quercetin dioxygenase-like cupin family protein
MKLTEETVTTKKIFLINPENVQSEDLSKRGAVKVKVRYLIDERQGSERFALRLYTVEKGGHTPPDQHEYEHHVYVLKGQGLLREGQENIHVLRSLHEGDSIFIPSHAVHQFINEFNEPLVFLCVKGNPTLYS